MADISKFVSNEKSGSDLSGFYVDFEDYKTGSVYKDYEHGDMVIWVFEGVRYSGVLKDNGDGYSGMFDLIKVKVIA